MPIDWGKINKLKESEADKNKGAADDEVPPASAQPKPAAPKPAEANVEAPAAPSSMEAEREQFMQYVNKYFQMHTDAADTVGGALKHVATTNPLDTVGGIAEGVGELVSGLFASFIGTMEGGGAALDEALRDPNKPPIQGPAGSNAIMQEKYGYEDAIITPEMREQYKLIPDAGLKFLALYNEAMEAFTYEPKYTETGKALHRFIQSVFQKFGAWGKDAGDFVFDKTGSPAMATAVGTGIEGAPYWVPAVLAKGKMSARQKAKAKERVQKLEDLVEKNQLEVIPDLELIAFSDKLSPKNVEGQITNSPGRVMRNREEYIRLSKRLDEEGVKKPIEFTRTEDGKLQLKDQMDMDIVSLARVKGIEEIPIRITESTKSAKGKQTLREIIEIESAKVRRSYEKGRADLEALERQSRKTILSRLGTATLDVSGELKARIIKQAGEAGEKAVMYHDLIAGATPKAQLRFQRWEDKIYKGLSKSDFTNLNEIIQSRRIMQIDKIKGPGKVKHPNNTTGDMHNKYLVEMRESLGADKFQDLWNRSNEYFRSTNEVLIDLYANGLIDKKVLAELRDLVYEPRKFINRIDPSRTQTLGNKTISVHDSGLKDLSRGAIRALEQDSRALLAEYMVRAENRIAKNKANQALVDFARLVPDNGWVKVAENIEWTKRGKAKKVHVPEGHVRVDAVIDGKQHPLIMDAKMAEQWVTQSPQMSAMMANTVRALSGSMAVRPLATGYNPGFALVNLPRDITHAYLATSEFSTHLPIFSLQIGKELTVTFKDAWRKDGRFNDFINEGGGMNFLTHQGTEFISKPAGKVSPGLTPKWRHIKEAMSKINEFSEIWVRLALRERAIKNGRDPIQATWIARNYLDFAQGGWATKGVDHAIPYLNASIQAFRTTAREAKKHPAKFAAKVMWLQSTAASLWLSNYFTNPEGWADVSPAERRQNWIIMTPYSFIDQMGNTRHLYFKVKKDNTMISPVGAVELLLERYIEGRIPDKEMLNMLKDSAPVAPTEVDIPVLSMRDTYLSNYNFWTDEKIWRGDENLPAEDEFKIAPKKPTSPFWKDFGELTGLSPERSAAAARKVLPINPYTSITGMGYKLMSEGMNEYDRSQHVLQMLNDTPILRRIIGLTHPAARELEGIEKLEEAGAGYRYDLSRKIDNLYFQMKQGELQGGERTVRTWINAQPPEERDRLARRLESQKAYDRIMAAYEGPVGIPSRTWWVHTGQLDSITRADIFYLEWRDADSRGRRAMETVAGRMSAQGLGYRTDDFNRRLSQLKKFYGTDYYGEGESREPVIIPRSLKP